MTGLAIASLTWILLAWHLMRLWTRAQEENDDLLIKLQRANSDNVALAERCAEVEQQLTATFTPYDPNQDQEADDA